MCKADYERNYDKWLQEQPIEEIYIQCENCENDIYIGEEYYYLDGIGIHIDCFDEYARNILKPKKRNGGDD